MNYILKGTISADLNGYPKKPKIRCTLGREIRLQANHYGIMLKNAFTVTQYDISIFSVSINKKNNKETEREVKAKIITK